MMRSYIAAFIAGVSASVLPRDGEQPDCQFQIWTYGGAEGCLGQIYDGQCRIGGGYQPATYVLKGDKIYDSQGRGCILTPPTGQWQCDAGATGTSGATIGHDGAVMYNGSPQFYACPVNDYGEWNVYNLDNANPGKCVPISMNTHGQCTQPNTPPAPPNYGSKPPPSPPSPSTPDYGHQIPPPPPPPSSTPGYGHEYPPPAPPPTTTPKPPCSSQVPPPPPPPPSSPYSPPSPPPSSSYSPPAPPPSSSHSPPAPPPSSPYAPPHQPHTDVPPPPPPSSTPGYGHEYPPPAPPPTTSPKPPCSSQVPPPPPPPPSSPYAPPPPSSSYSPPTPPPSSSYSAPPPPPSSSYSPPPPPPSSRPCPPESSHSASPPPSSRPCPSGTSYTYSHSPPPVPTSSKPCDNGSHPIHHPHGSEPPYGCHIKDIQVEDIEDITVTYDAEITVECKKCNWDDKQSLCHHKCSAPHEARLLQHYLDQKEQYTPSETS